MGGSAVGGQVGEDLPDHGHELEPVPGEAARHDHLFVPGMPGDHEMLVRGVGVHARHSLEEGPGQIRHPRCDEGPHRADFFRADGALDGRGRAGLPAAEEGHLDPARGPARRVRERREAVELAAAVSFPDVDGVTFRAEPFRAGHRCEPVLHLPFHAERHAQAGQQPRGPRPRAGHQLARGVRGRRGAHAHAPAPGGLPAGHRLPEVQLGAGPGGEREVGGDGFLRDHQPGAALVQRDVARRRRHGRKPAADLRGVEQLMRQAPLLRAAQAAGHGPAVRAAHHHAPGQVHDHPAGGGLDLRPQLGRPQQQRHVRRILEVRLPGDPRAAVAGPFIVHGGVPLQPEHPQPPLGQPVRRGAAHSAEPGHDDVVRRHARSSLRSRYVSGSTRSGRTGPPTPRPARE